MMDVGKVGNVRDVFTAAAVVNAVEHSDSQRSASQAGTQDARQAAASAERRQDEWLAGQREQAEEKKLTEEQVSQITEELNKLMSSINCNLQFSYHKEVDMMSVRMVDKETNEVIKELPPEDMIKNMENAQTWIGALLDTYA